MQTVNKISKAEREKLLTELHVLARDSSHLTHHPTCDGAQKWLGRGRAALKRIDSDKAAEFHKWEQCIHDEDDPKRRENFAGRLATVIQDGIATLRLGDFEGSEEGGPSGSEATPTPKQEPLPLMLPEKITGRWLFEHVPAIWWWLAGLALCAAFALGVRAGQINWVKDFFK